jgi:ubiquinone/menaquinone biosynthesis C-methylase UbiE
MAVRKDTLFERFLAPIFQHFLIDRDKVLQYYKSIDWDAERDRLQDSTLVYPDYYATQNFHGIEKGYLNVNAAISYDPITQYVIPPNETWVRQELIDRIQTQPRRILDLGCGTGSTTLMLKRAFPAADVIGLDLSPYMLVVADDKARKAGLNIQFRHANAEHTKLPDGSFDLITASLLFHETPPDITVQILREAFRLLTAGGQVLILDGNQFVLRHNDWITEIFEEPYVKDYAAGSVDAWMGAAGFEAVQTDSVWGLHQITRGVKPLPGRSLEWVRYEAVGEERWALG